MDKYEYKIRADEIKTLIAEGEYAQAVAIADTIDWRRVKSVMMLCMISDLYKVNKRYQESKEILLMAYERHPDGRLIIYSLCELSIKLEEYVQAIEYYKAFVQVAPKDTNRYILQYRIYEAQDVTMEERIAVLEEFKKKDYREKWAYELAYLYHRIGLASQCVDECDEMFLWFGEGRYVLKALELKQLHTPLNADQQLKYDLWQHGIETGIHAEKNNAVDRVTDIQASTDTADLEHAPTTKVPTGVELDNIEIKTVDVGMYNTVNLQKVVAEGIREAFSEEEEGMLSEEAGDSNVFGEDSDTGRMRNLQWSHTQSIRLSEEDFADAMEEPIEEVVEEEQLTEAPPEEQPQEAPEQVLIPEPVKEQPEERPLYTDPAGYLSASMPTQVWDPEELQKKSSIKIEDYISTREAKQVVHQMKQDTASLHALAKAQEENVPGAKTGVLTPLNMGNSPFDQMLSQEYDGQIKLAVPDDNIIEKQITGQMSIDDVLAEWEEMKKENEEKRKGEVRQRIIQHTGSLFDDFDEKTKTGLLEQLEKAFMDAIMKEDAAAGETNPNLDKAIEREVKRVADHILSQMAESEKAEADEEAVSVREETVDAEDTEDGVEELEEISEVSDDAADEEAADDEAIRMVEEELKAREQEAEQTKADLAEKAKEKKTKAAPARKEGARELSEEEKQLFAPYLKHKKVKDQLVYALDNISMAACTGNVIITGEEGVGTMQLAKNLVKEIQATDANFLGQVAKISGKMLNRKNIAEVLEQLKGGAMIIEKASGLNKTTAGNLIKTLNNENLGMIVILEDTKKAMARLESQMPQLQERFNIRIDIEALGDEALVAYAKEYAEGLEYSMDEFAVLALHLRIENMQTSDHDVTLAEVRELVDEAIYYADKKTPGHLMDVMFGKRYDDEDMIVLREKDFMHNS